jgi:hypothetical protein
MKLQGRLSGLPALFVSGALLGAALPAAWGANADVTVEVTAVPTQVTLSRPAVTSSPPSPALINYGAIQVTITPAQNNVINDLVFTSLATVDGTTPATFKESIPALACNANLAGDVVTCAEGQARASDGALTYVLIYESPTAGTSLQYDWTFTYSQAGSSSSASSTLKASSGQATAALTEEDDPSKQKFLKTFVPSFGGTFFTGSSSAKPGDPSTTTLAIPVGLNLQTTASVEEDDGVPGGQTTDTYTTNTTTIVIPSTVLFTAPIEIVLQRDASTIRVKTQNAADRVPIYYTAGLGEPWQPGALYPLKNCADIGGAPTAAEAVCVDKRIYVKNNMLGTAKPGGGFYTADDLSDFLFVLRALQNGRSFW